MRRRYLMMLQQAPWKLNGGALIRNYWMAMGVGRRYELDLVVAETADDPPPEFAAACASIKCFPKPSGTAYAISRAFDAMRPSNSYFTAGQVTKAQSEYVAAMCRAGGSFSLSGPQWNGWGVTTSNTRFQQTAGFAAAERIRRISSGT